MYLDVDKIHPNDIGGETHDMKKINYTLAMFNLTKEKLMSEVSKKTIIPTLMFHAGRYVVICQFNLEFTKGQMAFINFQIDLDKNFDHFADSFSPKTVAGFHQMQKTIENRGPEYWELVELVEGYPFK